METIIRHSTFQDKAALASFYKKAYGEKAGKLKYPERWDWLYKNNPFIPDSIPPIWIAIDDGEIIGHTGAMYVPLKVEENTLLASWSVDTILLSSCRGKGIGKRLQKANQDAHNIFMSLSMSEANRFIKLKLGGIERDRVKLFVLVRKLESQYFLPKESWVKRFGTVWGSVSWWIWKSIGFSHATAWYYCFALRYRQSQFSLSSTSNKSVQFDFERLETRFGDDVDEFWKAIRDHYFIAVERNSIYLNWKFIDQPFINYQCYKVYEKGKLKGIIIFRIGSPPEEHSIGIIAELISVDEECILSMIKFARSKLIEQGAFSIYCASSLPIHQQALFKQEFLMVSDDTWVFHDKSNKIGSMSTEKASYFSKGDHDWDQYQKLRQLSLLEIKSTLRKATKRNKSEYQSH